MRAFMQNTTTKTARNIVRNICAANNISLSKHTYTNMCADPELRNLCFTVSSMPAAVLQQLQQALCVKRVHATKTFAYAMPSTARYLRIVHCAK
jgi:hypothetical protein